jgi:hypothetical protein
VKTAIYILEESSAIINNNDFKKITNYYSRSHGRHSLSGFLKKHIIFKTAAHSGIKSLGGLI